VAAVASGNPTVMSASTFVIQVDGIKVASFSELSGINTEVNRSSTSARAQKASSTQAVRQDQAAAGHA